ncbi:hypothetical protein K491DRAFT_681177 [Lophiostoma macrostomum CBS 122681]|uniref:Uncharacterized protein n=1 Tax=Lophiostoma macrostomum CBS 122681 TaxID=1314788 RepID=A0A6A6T252_9PLEO|nr:hypothetical protein K491DRAFT_681177 [Lophiostoma macrostomum CBS 122681]
MTTIVQRGNNHFYAMRKLRAKPVLNVHKGEFQVATPFGRDDSGATCTASFYQSGWIAGNKSWENDRKDYSELHDEYWWIRTIEDDSSSSNDSPVGLATVTSASATSSLYPWDCTTSRTKFDRHMANVNSIENGWSLDHKRYQQYEPHEHDRS